MRKLFFVLLFCIASMFSYKAFGEAKKELEFVHNGETYSVAVDTSRTYIEYEKRKFRTFEHHKIWFFDGFSKDVKNDYETDYIICWKGKVFVVTDNWHYTFMKYIMVSMLQQKDSKRALGILENVGDLTVEDIVSGKAGVWNILGFYDKDGTFFSNPATRKW